MSSIAKFKNTFRASLKMFAKMMLVLLVFALASQAADVEHVLDNLEPRLPKVLADLINSFRGPFFRLTAAGVHWTTDYIRREIQVIAESSSCENLSK